MTRWDVLREVLALGALIVGLVAEVVGIVFLLVYGPWWIALPVIVAAVFVGLAVLAGRWDPERTLAERAAREQDGGPVDAPQPVAGTPDRPVRMPRLPTRDTR